MSRPVFVSAACSVVLLVPVPVAAVASGGAGSVSHASSKASHASARHHQRRRHSALVSDNSGSVVSFDGSVLKVKRADGSVLTGRVDSATRASCESELQFEAEHAVAAGHRRRGATAKAARNGGPVSGSDSGGAAEAGHPENEVENEAGDVAEHSAGAEQSGVSCGMADVRPGAKVDAKLAAGSKALLAEIRLVK